MVLRRYVHGGLVQDNRWYAVLAYTAPGYTGSAGQMSGLRNEVVLWHGTKHLHFYVALVYFLADFKA